MINLQELLREAVGFQQHGNPLEAERRYLQILQSDAENFDARNMLGLLRFQQGRFEEALEYMASALRVSPHAIGALSNYGNALQAVGRFDEALASYDRALAANPRHARALNNRGVVLAQLKRFDDALASYDQALKLEPDYAEAMINRGAVLAQSNRLQEALSCFDRALATQPGHPGALFERGNVLWSMKQLELALASYEGAFSIDPGFPHALDRVVDAALHLCDWSKTVALDKVLTDRVAASKPGIEPLTLLALHDDAALQLKCARNVIRDRIPIPRRALWEGRSYRHARIRIAYLSSDFREHPVAAQIAQLIELHDRSRFDVIGVSFGENDGSKMRDRLVKAFDRFHDVSLESDLEVAALLRRLEIDIAVDLNGHTLHARPEILSYRPCPVQVNYLGYAGTMGAEFIDYVIADKTVAPFEHQQYFTEKIVHLPDCFLVGDSQRVMAQAPTRKSAGLPETAFVFCCFNGSWKLSPHMFAIWMRLLLAVEGSVLWLKQDNMIACKHLRQAAVAHGVKPERLIFAERVGIAEHFARHQLADLFLDTLAYNAHATASDALWSGLPVLTCEGRSFAGRVGASLLRAAGLPELVTGNLDAYEALALRLATEGTQLSSLRKKLQADRRSAPLFSADRYRSNIEAAYVNMWEISERGETPKNFGVHAAI